MKIVEAIEELEEFNAATFDTRFVTFTEALQLGIEALKRLEEMRRAQSTGWRGLLPRETPAPKEKVICTAREATH